MTGIFWHGSSQRMIIPLNTSVYNFVVEQNIPDNLEAHVKLIDYMYITCYYSYIFLALFLVVKHCFCFC